MTLGDSTAPIQANEPYVSTEPYESAGELRKQHEALLRRLDELLSTAHDADGESAAFSALEPEILTFLSRGAATGVFVEELRERTACQTLLDYWATAPGAAQSKPRHVRLERFDHDRLPLLPEEACPYVGLEAFRDSRFFFGRDADTSALRAQLEEAALVVVGGGSGSGKSSLVMAGLLPRIRQEQPQPWRLLPVVVPGIKALSKLCEQVGGFLHHAIDPALLLQDPGLLRKLVGEEPTLLVVDQFEELFTVSELEERDAFVAAIAGLLQGGQHRVLLTLREEFRSQLPQLRPLEPWLDKAWFSMRPLNYEELRRAIERPARAANLEFHPDLVDRLAKRVLGQPTALPLLQFTLRELWKRRDRNRITHAVYESVGDPLVALQSEADAFVDRQPPEVAAEIERILVSLVYITDLLEAYRRPVLRSTLTAAGRANTEAVLQLLSEHGYVRMTSMSANRDALVEIQHEALIRNWPRLVHWINARRTQLRDRLALTQAALRWKALGRPEDLLLPRLQVELAQSYADLTADEQTLVEASADFHDRKRRAKEQELIANAEAAKRAEASEKHKRKRDRIIWTCVVSVLSILAVLLWRSNRALETERERLVRSTNELRDAVEINERNLRQAEAAARVAASNSMKEAEAAAQQAQTAERLVEALRGSAPMASLQLAALLEQQLKASEQVVQAKVPPTVYLHIADESQRGAARKIAAELRDIGCYLAGIQNVMGNGGVPKGKTAVRYFHKEDGEWAVKVKGVLEKAGVPAEIKLKGDQVPVGRVMVWFAPPLKMQQTDSR